MPESKNTRPRSRRAAAPKPSQPRKVQPISPTASPDYKATMSRLAATLDLKNLDDAERAFLATCQKIERRHTGCNSPFEEFFHNLVRYVQRDQWPTPDDAAAELETFREHFDDMRRDAAWFLENYPQSSAAAPGAEPTGHGRSLLKETAALAQEPAEGAPELDRREKDWQEKTPDLSYCLECFSPNDLEQKIELTRDEYIRLKEHLVRVRGFIAQEAAHA